ncbi:MAG TPA: hypothetical protein ENI38_00110, partial [Candidatus Acetothermia bacterium]|nr:hypothetical protein [Candidatus Acetothermia bacterium]
MWLRELRWKRLRRRPFPVDWERNLLQRSLVYRHLPLADREELHGHIQVFLAEKRFEGAGGQKITDEV